MKERKKGYRLSLKEQGKGVGGVPMKKERV
jgi:hypothetical protein